MVRYRKIVCKGQRGKTVIADILFAEYWKTRFQKKGESFVPDVTNGIQPLTAEPVGITSGGDQVSRSEFISSSSTGIPETYSSLESNETGSLVSPSLTPPPVSSSTAVLSSLSSGSVIIPPHRQISPLPEARQPRLHYHHSRVGPT